MTESLVSIIIVSWNSEKFLKECIASLENQTYQNFEIILVDNASTDNSVNIVKTNFPKVKLVENKKNLGFAEGNNIGIKNSKGDLIELVNPDVITEKEWLQHLVKKIQSSNSIGGVTGKMYYMGNKFGKNAVFCTWSKVDPYTAMPFNFTNDEPTAKVDYLSGAAMLVKKEVIDKIGFLDPGYFLYFEETDWCARMIRAGYDLVYVPEAIVWHEVSSAVSDSPKKLYYMERNRTRFAIKNFDTSYLIAYLCYSFFESIFVIFRDLNNNSSRSKIRLQALNWNFKNFSKTIKSRKKYMAILKKFGPIKSYNNSLPLRKIVDKN